MMARRKFRPGSLAKRLGGAARRFAVDNSATSAIEYAIMTFIAVAVIAVVTQLGGTVDGMYQRVQEVLGN
jgi:Flp pilus assembly pilin Flp